MTNVYDKEALMEFDEFVRFLEADTDLFADALEEGDLDPRGRLQQIWVRDIHDTLLWDKKPRDLYVYNRLFKFKRSTDPKKATLSVDTENPVLLFKDTPNFKIVEWKTFAPATIIALDPGIDYFTINYLYDLVAVFVFFYRRTGNINESINEFVRAIELCRKRAREKGSYLAPELMGHLYAEFYLKDMSEQEGGN